MMPQAAKVRERKDPATGAAEGAAPVQAASRDLNWQLMIIYSKSVAFQPL